jgi:D-3-phosphoglycerate dehydrogenase
VGAEAMEKNQVRKLSFDDVIEQSDFLSLHLPLTPETQHIVNKKLLTGLKKGGILINTSRGGLIDTDALVEVLRTGNISAGLDVYEDEPVPAGHPILQCENAVLTSHTAWYSERSVPTLQRMAAEELIRGVKGEILKNRVA